MGREVIIDSRTGRIKDVADPAEVRPKAASPEAVVERVVEAGKKIEQLQMENDLLRQQASRLSADLDVSAKQLQRAEAKIRKLESALVRPAE